MSISRLAAVALAVVVLACSGGSDAGGPAGPPAPAPPPAPPPPPPPPTTGTISGRVSSSAGSAVEGATITTQPATSSATSDAQGNYSIANVPAGSYTVTAARTGYSAGSATVSVAGGQVANANLSLVSLALPFTYNQVAQIQAVTGNAIASIALSPDGRWLAYGSFGDNLVHLIDVASRQEIRTFAGHLNRVTEVAFSPDSRFLASSGTVNLGTPSDGSVRIWDVTTGAQLASAATPGTSQLVFTPDGQMLLGASGGNPVSIRVWSVAGMTLARTISGVFRFAALNPNATRVASGARNNSLHVYDFASGTSVAAHAGHSGWVTAAAYNATGQSLASAGEDRRILVRDAQTGMTSMTLSGHLSYPDVLVFSPDGKALASLGTGVNVTQSGGSIIVTIGAPDRFIRIWNLATGQEYSRVNIGSDAVAGISFSADWRRLVTGSDEGLIRIFERAD